MSDDKKIAFFTDLHIGVHQNSEKWYDVAYEWAKSVSYTHLRAHET